MKVCLLNDSFPPVIDGVANAVQNYASVLTAKGIADVIVATPGYPDADYGDHPYRVIPYKSIDTTHIVAGYRAGFPFERSVIDEIKAFEPDIIHCHCPFSSMVLARMIRSSVKVPIVFTYHTKFDVDIKRAVKAEFIEKEVIKAIVSNISAADEVWAVSRGAGDDLRALGFEGDIRVMGNGVDFEKGCQSAEKVAEVTAPFDLPQGVPVFLFVGRIMDYKGLPLIAEALKKLSAADVDYRAVFIGGGVDAPKMKARFTDAGITVDEVAEGGGEGAAPEIITHKGRENVCGRAIFTGPIYDRAALRAWNTRADLFLFPSAYDTNGIVVREAAACSTASVLLRGSCAAEGITDRRNGYIIDETADDMAALLKELASDIPAVKAVGENAMNEIYISWEDAVGCAAERYKAVISDYRQRLENEPDRAEEFRELMQKEIKLPEFHRDPESGMRSNFNALLDDAESFGHTMKEVLRDSLREYAAEVREFSETAKEAFENGISRGVRHNDELKETAKEAFENGISRGMRHNGELKEWFEEKKNKLINPEDEEQ